MSSRASLYTRLDVDDDEADVSASVMLASDGSGTVMACVDGDPQFSIRAESLHALLRVLTECEQFRTRAQRSPAAPLVEPRPSSAEIIPFPVRLAQ